VAVQALIAYDAGRSAARYPEERNDTPTGVETVPPIDFTSAYYIKLGRGGEWESDSIEHGRLRIGWRGQSVDDINSGRWHVIEKQLRAKDHGKRVPATTSDFNALKCIATSTADDIWITFHKAKLWWARLASSPVEQDSVFTENRYVVQVKSRASLTDLHKTIAGFSPDDFRRVFFVAHSPNADLVRARGVSDHVEIVGPQRLRELAIDAGLAEWLEDKVS
jgi:hypothetical protein